jgi:hypothetical protein
MKSRALCKDHKSHKHRLNHGGREYKRETLYQDSKFISCVGTVTLSRCVWVGCFEDDDEDDEDGCNDVFSERGDADTGAGGLIIALIWPTKLVKRSGYYKYDVPLSDLLNRRH